MPTEKQTPARPLGGGEEEEEDEEKVSMLTSCCGARGMGKKDKKSICRPMVPSLGTVKIQKAFQVINAHIFHVCLDVNQ